jgi:REP element-mobilizing transposase RayT
VPETEFPRLSRIKNDGGAYFITSSAGKDRKLTGLERAIALDSIKFFRGERFALYAAVVMPDHFHMLLQPCFLPDSNRRHDIGKIVASIKKYSARKINAAAGQTGSLWLDNYFSRVIVSEKALARAWQYILMNPVEAKLARRWEEYPYVWTAGMK